MGIYLNGEIVSPFLLGNSSSSGKDGKSINWCGEYSETTQYSRLDAVSHEGSSYIFSSGTPATGVVPGVDNEWELMAKKGGAGINITGATIGQTVKIASVDENGVPTAWVPVDMASGGGGDAWEEILNGDTIVGEPATMVYIPTNRQGNPKKLRFKIKIGKSEVEWTKKDNVYLMFNYKRPCYDSVGSVFLSNSDFYIVGEIDMNCCFANCLRMRAFTQSPIYLAAAS